MLYHWIILLFIMIVAAYDFLYKKIPNFMNLSIVIFALIYTLLSMNFDMLLGNIIGLFLGLALLIIPYALGGMAAGDVKLMGAVGAALGPFGVIMAFLYSAVAGGIYALILIIGGRTGDLPKRFWNMVQTFYYTKQLIYDKPQKPEQQVKLCYGVAIAAGTILYIVLEMTGSKQLIQF